MGYDKMNVEPMKMETFRIGGSLMSSVKAFYDGSAFVPIESVNIPKGIIVNLSFLQDETINSKNVEKLAAFRQLTKEIREINKSEPLPQEFDEILANRVNFTGEFGL